MKAKELRAKSVTELTAELQELLKEQFNLRMQMNAEGGPSAHQFKRVRRTIARMKTILQEKANDNE